MIAFERRRTWLNPQIWRTHPDKNPYWKQYQAITATLVGLVFEHLDPLCYNCASFSRPSDGVDDHVAGAVTVDSVAEVDVVSGGDDLVNVDAETNVVVVNDLLRMDAVPDEDSARPSELLMQFSSFIHITPLVLYVTSAPPCDSCSPSLPSVLSFPPTRPPPPLPSYHLISRSHTRPHRRPFWRVGAPPSP